MRQNSKRFRLDVWGWTTIVILLLYALFLLYPLSLLLKMAFSDGVHFTLENFAKFFSRKYYSITDSGKEQLIFLKKEWNEYYHTIDDIIEGRMIPNGK